MTPSMIWRLPAAQRRSRPCPLGVVLGSRHHQRALLVGPVPLPSNASEPFVGQIELVSILADKPIRYGALLGNDLGHPEGGDDALRAHREPYREPTRSSKRSCRRKPARRRALCEKLSPSRWPG